MRRLVESTWAHEAGDELRARLVQDGYLYLPGFLDPVAVRETSESVREALRTAGWVGADGTFRPTSSEHAFTAASFRTVYPEVQRLEAVHRLAHSERLLGLARALLGADVFCHPAKVVRLAAPRAEAGYTTQAHQDHVVHVVCSDVLTVWSPITECSATRQGIRILPGSHLDGPVPTDPTLPGARPLYVDVDPEDERWATADFSPGDVVLFHGFTVHGGGPNTSDELRISIDVRYQRRDDPMLETFARPHGWPATPDWDALCEGWSSRRWVDVPADVRLVPPPPADANVAELTPPSRLLSR